MADTNWQAVLRPMLEQAGLTPAIAAVVPLTGGVSSDIVRVDLDDGGVVCAKRALARLNVASAWEAPVERNHYEVAWLRLAGSVVPGVAPRVLGEDRANGIALLEFLPEADYRVWKGDLLQGRFQPGVAEAVAGALARVHAATWGRRDVAEEFATDAMFEALRLSPYLRTLAERTPDLAGPILAVADETAGTRLALVHGDVSPKNILVSQLDGHPVLLDAECAWYGDPAFDAAFCINHLFLKAVHVPALRDPLMAAARGFFATWLDGVPVGARRDAEGRLARLLPCLLLARIDGKSPVEYLGEAERSLVRKVSRPMIARAPHDFAELAGRFESHFSSQDLR